MIRPHRIATVVLILALGLWSAAMAWSLARAERSDGRHLAAFGRSVSPDAALAAVIAAGGLVVGRTWLPGAWLVAAEDPAFPERLRAVGPVWVLPAAPFEVTTIGGCGIAPWWRSAPAKVPVSN